MKDREIQCRYYINEGNCKKGHKGTFCKTCQTCKDYIPLKKARPRRQDLRRKKNTKWMNDMNNFV